MAVAIRGAKNMSKRISVSVKRQITIPLQYFEELGIGTEVDCELKEGEIVIRPVKSECSGEFDEFILADLIKEGHQGTELLEKFKEMRKQIRPAVLRMLEATEKEARPIPFEELFGSEDDD